MSDSGLVLLRRTLLARYETLVRYLSRRLGSTERAAEALADTYLKLERTKELGVVHDPEGYLLRMAANLALNKDRAEKQRAKTETAALYLHVFADLLPDPEQVASARSELAAFVDALKELSPRQQSIVILARVEKLPTQAIAQRFGVSTRTVELELRRALDHCGARIGRKAVQRFGPARRAVSSEQKSKD